MSDINHVPFEKVGTITTVGTETFEKLEAENERLRSLLSKAFDLLERHQVHTIDEGDIGLVADTSEFMMLLTTPEM